MATRLPSRPQLVTELGSIGLPGGTPQDGFIQAEFLPELRGAAGMRKYREMADNDPVVGALLFAMTMPIRNLDWRIEAADDSDAAAEAKAFLEDVLFHGMRTPWPEVVAEALSMLTYGYTLMEIVWAQRADGRLGVAKLAIRAQETLWRWRFDEAMRDLAGVEQFAPDGVSATIPAYKFLLFRTVSDRGNPEGRSVLRNAYIPYLRKGTIEQAEGRAAIRSAGIVALRIPGRYMAADADAADKAVYTAYQAIAATLAQDRQGSVVLPGDRDTGGNRMVELDYVVADGRRPTDMSPIVDRMNRMIATSVLADFIFLGQQAVGSFALASSKTGMFARSVGAVVAVVADVVNRDLVPRLWAYNGLDDAVRPRLVAADLETPDLLELGDYLTRLSGAGMPLFPDQKLEGYLRAVAKLPSEHDEVG